MQAGIYFGSKYMAKQEWKFNLRTQLACWYVEPSNRR